jgi:hypothetical protein
MAVLESEIESYLVSEVTRIGGVADKVVSLGGRGYFDRVVVLPHGIVSFVEVKKPKGSRTAPHQMLRANTYRVLGADVAMVKTKSEVDALLARLTSGA